MAKKKKKAASGSARMKALGHKPVQIWLDSHELDLVRRAAAAERRPPATFIRVVAVSMAKAILREEAPGAGPWEKQIQAGDDDENEYEKNPISVEPKHRFKVVFKGDLLPRDVIASSESSARQDALHAELMTGHKGPIFIDRVLDMHHVGSGDESCPLCAANG